MTTVGALAPARLAFPRSARCRVATGTPRIGVRRVTPVVWPAGHTDQLVIVEAVTETRLGELRSARITDKPTWVLNGVGSMGFSCSTSDPGLDALTDPSTVVDGAGVLHLLGREVQWWRDGVFMWAGVPASASVSLEGIMGIGAFDLGWYLTRRVFGAAERRDLLAGIGQMDRTGLTGWRTTDTAVMTRDIGTKARGVSSAALTGTGAITAGFPTPESPVAGYLALHITGVARLPSGTPVGTPVATLTVRDAPAGTIADSTVIRTTEDTTLGAWWRFSGYVLVPPSAPHWIDVDLWTLGTYGTTRFDDVRVLKNDMTSANSVDLTTHALSALRHFQGPDKHLGFGFRPRRYTTAGTSEPLRERHAAHVQATDFLARYTERSDGFDWWIDPTTREFCVAHRRGIDHANLVLHERSIAAGSWTHDETETATDVIVLGEGDGIDRPEGGYRDRRATRGLLSLDYVHQPPDGTPLSALNPMAQQVWADRSQPQVAPSALSVSADLFPDLSPGDRVRVAASTGKVRLPATWTRIGQIAYDLDAHQLELT